MTMHNAPQNLHISQPPPLLHIEKAGSYSAPKGKHYPPHQHAIWEVVYYRSGHIPCPVGNEHYVSEPGLMLINPPQVVHWEHASEAYSNQFFTVAAPPQQPWPHVYLDGDTRIFAELFQTIVQEWEGDASDREAMLALLVQQFDILLRRTQLQEQFSAGEHLVREAERLMAERFNSSLTINAIAKELGISTAYLREQFTLLRGKSPLAHLQAIRLEHALIILRTSDASLDMIANFCGYDSASHLSRYVKRATGKSPGALRSEKKCD